MALAIPQVVLIQNKKLKLIYHSLFAIVFVYCVAEFFLVGKYYRKVSNRPSMKVSETPTDDFVACNTSEHRLCTPVEMEAPLANGAYFVLREGCVGACQQEFPRDAETCLTSIDLHKVDSVKSIFTTLRTIKAVYNVNITDPYGKYTVTLINEMHALIDYANYTFKFRLELAEPPIPYFFGLNSPDYVPRTTSSSDCVTLVIDAAGAPVSGLFFPLGSEVVISAPLLIYLAMQRRQTFDLSEQDLWYDDKLNVNDGSKTRIPGWAYNTGISIAVELSCVTSARDLQLLTHNYGYDWAALQPNRAKPVCVMSVHLEERKAMRYGNSDQVDGRTELKQFYGLHIVTKEGLSYHRVYDPDNLLLFLTTLLVLLRVPMQIVKGIALNFLGHLSNVYQAALQPEFSVQDHCVRTVLKSIADGQAFLEIADIPDGQCGIPELSKEKLLERLLIAFKLRASDLDENEVRVLVEFVYQHMSHAFRKSVMDGTREVKILKSLNIDQFCSRAGAHHLDLDTIVKMFDKDRKRHLLERLFLPSAIAKGITQSNQVKCDEPLEPPSDFSQPSPPEPPSDYQDPFDVQKQIGAKITQIDDVVKALKDEFADMRAWRTVVDSRLRCQEPSPKLDSSTLFHADKASHCGSDCVPVDFQASLLPERGSQETGVKQFHHEIGAQFDERISRLERLIGHLHEPHEQEHQALDFDIRFHNSINLLTETLKDYYCKHFARSLSCDHVELHSGIESGVVCVQATGFVNMECVTRAAAKLRVSSSEIFDVVGDTRHSTRMHRASYWLQWQQYLCNDTHCEHRRLGAPRRKIEL